MWFVRLMWIFPLLMVAGCGGEKAVKSRHSEADEWIVRGGLLSEQIDAGTFSLFSAHRFRRGTPALTIYLEGDGRAWASRYRLSSDPTPVDPVALRLASIHAISYPEESVGWLARPCQYQRPMKESGCEKKYWSSHRFSEAVINSVNQAVTQMKKANGANKLRLVGFSGGGAVAALVAARRDDVVGLVTVAGNLDHQWVNSHHGVSPLYGSLNPIDVAGNLSQLAQIHFTGKSDEIVPGGVVTRFIAYGKADLCAQKREIAGAAHTEGWEERWEALWREVELSLACS